MTEVINENTEEKQHKEKRISRSQFLKGAGAALAGAVVVRVADTLAPAPNQTAHEAVRGNINNTVIPDPPLVVSTSTADLRSPVTTGTSNPQLLASQIGFNSDLIGATVRNVQAKLGEYVSAGDFGAIPNGDPNQNYTALSQALDAVAGTKATLLLSAGVYPVSGELSLKSDVTVAGDGMKGSIIMSVSGAASILAARNVQRVTIRDLGFRAKERVTVSQAINVIGAEDLLIERCWFDEMFHWSVYFGAGSLHCGVVNSISEGTDQAHSIELNGSSYCYVMNCHLKNSMGNGIEIYHNTNQECLGNRLIANHIAGSKGGGILSHGERYAAIIANTVVDTISQGIRIVRSEVEASYMSIGGLVTGNSVLNCGRAGVLGIDIANDTLAWSVSGNTVKEAGSAGLGILGDAHTISGNICIENAKDGLFIGGGSHVISHNTCINNNAQRNSGSGSSGIYILSTGSSYTGNVCTDTRAVKLQEYGINVQGSNNTLTGNVTNGNKLGGLNDPNPNRVNIKVGNI